MPLRVATVNVNGVRAAVRKGMTAWLESADVDVLTLQEVRASAAELAAVMPGWSLVNDEASLAGRAGVAIATREPVLASRAGLGGPDDDFAGRWIEADLPGGVTVVSAYVHSGEADTPRQVAKYAFLDAMQERMAALGAGLAVVTGDLNVGHRELDIRNWKGNVKRAGFLPRERAYFDRILGDSGSSVTGVDGSVGAGLGWVDVGRRFHGEVDGPYTWWSMRGRAYDNDTGWRIDYHLATPQLAASVRDYRIVKAPSWDTRWSDHAPVVVDYAI